MLSKNRLGVTSAYTGRGDVYELSVVRSYESGDALYDVVTFEDGTTVIKKNLHVVTDPSAADQKFYDFIKGARLPDPVGMWKQDMPRIIIPSGVNTAGTDNRPMGQRSRPSGADKPRSSSPGGTTLGGMR